MEREELVPLGIYCGLTTINMFIASVALVYVSLAIPLGIMVLKARKDKNIKYWLTFGAMGGALYPVAEHLLVPSGWGSYLISDLYVLSTPLHMCFVVMFAVASIGYLSAKMELWHTIALAFTLTFIIENFNSQAGFWIFSAQKMVWNVPLSIITGEVITLSSLKYLKVRTGPVIWSMIGGLTLFVFRYLIP